MTKPDDQRKVNIVNSKYITPSYFANRTLSELTRKGTTNENTTPTTTQMNKLQKFTLTGVTASAAVSLKVLFVSVFASVPGTSLLVTLICTLPFCAMFFFTAAYLITTIWTDS